MKLSAEKSEKHSALVLEEMTIGNLEAATCLRFGPVGERRLPELRRGIERSGLIGRLVMEETDASIYMVYSGPFKSEGTAKQELKRLTDLGLQRGGPFLWVRLTSAQKQSFGPRKLREPLK